jgi:hypothetical protein
MMFVACGIGSYDVATIYLVSHAFFKSAIFLSFVYAMHGFVSPSVIWVSFLSASGFPVLPGFFAKTSLAHTLYFHRHIMLFVFDIVINIISNIVIFRMTLWARSAGRSMGPGGYSPVWFLICGGTTISCLSWNIFTDTFKYFSKSYIEILCIIISVCSVLFLERKSAFLKKADEFFEPIFRARSIVNQLRSSIRDVSRSLSKFYDTLRDVAEHGIIKCVATIAVCIGARQMNIVSVHMMWIIAGLAFMFVSLTYEVTIVRAYSS